MTTYTKTVVFDVVFLSALFLGVSGNSVLLAVTVVATWLIFLVASLHVLLHHHEAMFKIRVQMLNDFYSTMPRWWPAWDVATDLLWLGLLAYGSMWMTLGAAAISCAVKFWNRRITLGMLHKLEA